MSIESEFCIGNSPDKPDELSRAIFNANSIGREIIIDNLGNTASEDQKRSFADSVDSIEKAETVIDIIQIECDVSSNSELIKNLLINRSWQVDGDVDDHLIGKSITSMTEIRDTLHDDMSSRGICEPKVTSIHEQVALTANTVEIAVSLADVNSNWSEDFMNTALIYMGNSKDFRMLNRILTTGMIQIAAKTAKTDPELSLAFTENAEKRLGGLLFDMDLGLFSQRMEQIAIRRQVMSVVNESDSVEENMVYFSILEHMAKLNILREDYFDTRSPTDRDNARIASRIIRRYAGYGQGGDLVLHEIASSLEDISTRKPRQGLVAKIGRFVTGNRV